MKIMTPLLTPNGDKCQRKALKCQPDIVNSGAWRFVWPKEQVGVRPPGFAAQTNRSDIK